MVVKYRGQVPVFCDRNLRCIVIQVRHEVNPGTKLTLSFEPDIGFSTSTSSIYILERQAR